jgi:hypothetical protein
MNPPAASAIPAVVLPCTDGATWVVPLNSLAEVVVVSQPVTDTLDWRGQLVPVHGTTPAANTYAVLFGLAGHGAPSYWAVPLASLPLEYRLLQADDLRDQAAEELSGVLAVAQLDGRLCRVPDLGEFWVDRARLCAGVPNEAS